MQNDQRSEEMTPEEAAEAKRRLARRRLLTGGAGAGAAIVTLGVRPTYAYSLLTCLSKGGKPKSTGLAGNEKKSDVYCQFD